MQDNVAESDHFMGNVKWEDKSLAVRRIVRRRRIVRKDVDANTKGFHSPLHKWDTVYT